MATAITTTNGRAQPIAERPDDKPLVTLRAQLEQRTNEFKMVLPAHITPEKLQRTIITAAQTNPDLLMANRQSLMTACMKAAQDGLLPDGREAALVIFETNQKDAQNAWHKVKLAQYMPMVYGLRKKILQSGEVRDIFAQVVYRREVEEEYFIYEEGSERMLRHKPILDPDFEPKDEDIVGAYSVATFNDGTMSFEFMRRGEINKVREVSKTGATRDKKGQPREPKGPWVEWFAEMAKKTVMRRHSKTLPMSGDIIDDDMTDDAFSVQSTRRLLEVEPDAPRSIEGPLPSRAELARAEGADEQTGEIIDAQANDAGEGRAQEQMGEQHLNEQGREIDPREAKAEEIIQRAKRLETVIDYNKLLEDEQATVDAMPEELAGACEKALRDARKRLLESAPA